MKPHQEKPRSYYSGRIIEDMTPDEIRREADSIGRTFVFAMIFSAGVVVAAIVVLAWVIMKFLIP